jgi:hypothetical protein
VLAEKKKKEERKNVDICCDEYWYIGVSKSSFFSLLF